MNEDLLNSLKEMREACAACFRVILQFDGATDILDAEFRRIGIREGFGQRASQAIAQAEARVREWPRERGEGGRIG